MPRDEGKKEEMTQTDDSRPFREGRSATVVPVVEAERVVLARDDGRGRDQPRQGVPRRRGG